MCVGSCGLNSKRLHGGMAVASGGEGQCRRGWIGCIVGEEHDDLRNDLVLISAECRNGHQGPIGLAIQI